MKDSKVDPPVPRIPWKIQEKQIEEFLLHSGDKEMVSNVYADLIVLEIMLSKLIEEQDE